jgi:hypothetical protein
MIVRDEDRCQSEIIMDVPKGPSQFAADFGVQGSEWLVQQQDLGLTGKRSSECSHAALTSR